MNAHNEDRICLKCAHAGYLPQGRRILRCKASGEPLASDVSIADGMRRSGACGPDGVLWEAGEPTKFQPDERQP